MNMLGEFAQSRSLHPSVTNVFLRGVPTASAFASTIKYAYHVLHRSKSQFCSSHFTTHATTAGGTTTIELLEQQIASTATAQHILDVLEHTPLPDLMAAAANLRDQGHPSIITFSPKVFLPLTRLCRDSCGYCTFAQGPVPGHRVYMTIEEMLTVARMGAEQGCTEALFTLGELNK
jgi:hypothetical protein